MFSAAKTSAPASGGLLSKSLRFRSSATAYLSRTFSTPTNNKIWTWSGWVKGGLFGDMRIFSAATGGSAQASITFNANSTVELAEYTGSYAYRLTTTQVFRDPSAWYHIVGVYDSTQATAANRVKLYVNGNQVTALTNATYPTQNYNGYLNSAMSHTLGSYMTTGNYLDGYMTDIYFIDGQALTPSSFASTNATTGQWSPAKYTGTYGTNGFHLTFANTTSTTTLGYDTSGNSNNWTTNNISLTAGATYDSMNDVPVAYSATAANYAVLNPLVGSCTLSNGNLAVSIPPVNNCSVSTIGNTSGKWYCEMIVGTISGGDYAVVGIGAINTTNWNTGPSITWATAQASPNYVQSKGGFTFSSNTITTTYTTGDVIGIALDLNGNTLAFYKNGTSQGSMTISISGTIAFLIAYSSGSNTSTGTVNFGQQGFTYTPPSGYNALNTYNLPTPTIAQGNKYMDATLYTGNGSSQTITNSGAFQPDFVWAKGRSGATSNILVNAVTGANQFLLTDSTQAEATSSALVSAFTSTGFSIGSSTSINNSSSTYVGWQWKANGSGSTNTNGSITSTVSANTTSGFSVVTYTGSGTAGTIGHGLGIAPSMIIIKARSTTGDWPVYHTSVGNGSYTLIDTTAASASSATIWNATSPTSSVFSVGINTTSNTVTVTYVAYCFAPIAGFSAFGSWTGTGVAPGPFIYCGFQPRFILSKRTDTGGNNWMIIDTARNPYNVTGSELYPSSNNSELTGYSDFNVTSNGFQVAATYSYINASGGTYLYAAFASNPFAYSNAF